jgi:hypothetical protein
MSDEELEVTLQNYVHDQFESPVHDKRILEREILQRRFVKNKSTVRSLNSTIVRRVRKDGKTRLLRLSCLYVCPSSCPSAWKNTALIGRIFVNICVGDLY